MNEWQEILVEFDRRRAENNTDTFADITNIEWCLQAILEKLRNDAEKT